ncbi:helix-turn-helix transcriptional regulator [Lacibacter sp.]|uniref:helix-turn-helix transcriptional regulator n=1 Tax=Lacibacter sp. TaxID=1915409 RepID=UPI002B4AC7A2|nr:helix-turn-helix transcriptional regulator [Lacibacter sp.]HLP37095.1 helix-turn-helix transcriptional regulator [Lacibacter sp.]
MKINEFVKKKRKEVNLTQFEMSLKAGVGLRFVRDLEQGKKSLHMDKVNQVLWLFGYEVGPVESDREQFITNKDSRIQY